MMSAHIAYERLNPHARREVAHLLAVPLPLATPDFVGASYWADDVRYGRPEYKYTAPHHFVDYPYSPDGTPPPTDLPGAENVVRALNLNVALLKVPFTSDATKAEALRFVIHFVGDIHQPLHCVSRVSRSQPGGDLGGNAFPLPDKNGANPKYNLHAYWDDGAQRFPPSTAPAFAPPPLADVVAVAAQAVRANPDSAAAWREGGVDGYAAWAAEGNRIATKFVYQGIREGERPAPAYETQSFAVSQTRVAWAGYRLAALLNQLWP